jgi:uncharacterized membrane protein YbhN (UPF0104 family)
VIVILTNVFSLIFLGLALFHADLPRIWGEVRRMHWGWVTLAATADVMVYLLHGWRWRLMLRPIQRIPYLQFVRAIYAGLYANEVVPLRAGEVIRCFLLSRSSGVPISVTFASALIERIFDGIWLMAFFMFTLRIAHLPRALVWGGYFLGGFIVVASLVLAYGMYAREQSIKLFFEFTIPAWFSTLIEDLHLIGHSRYLYYAFFVSGIYLVAQAAPIFAVLQAYNLSEPWTAAFTMMVLLRLSAVVPQAPGNLGSFQWVAAKTLMLYGVMQAQAYRFSIVLWSILTLPLIAVGFVVVLLAGVSMSHLHREATNAASASRADDSAAP